MHNIPTPLDKHLIAYYSLENPFVNTYWVDINDVYVTNSVTFEQSNEPDLICKCDSDMLTSNFAYLT